MSDNDTKNNHNTLSSIENSDYEVKKETSNVVPVNQRTKTSSSSSIMVWSGMLVWPLMLTLPLAMTIECSPLYYKTIFKPEWYIYENNTPKALGLILGITAVGVGQFFTWVFFYLYRFGYLGHVPPQSIQTKGARVYNFWEGLQTHVSQPGGFTLLVGYLFITWMFNLMPLSYYNFDGTIQYKELLICLIIQDGIQYIMHRLEHDVSSTFYQISHKPHHRFINPRLFDAFDGSILDTLCMIIIPLYITANIIRTVNVWTYMAFGSSYSCWLTLIHSEYVFPWDNIIFRKIGFGTPGDHHVHHKFFKYNYGHLFMWFDQLFGTYKDPNEFTPKAFNNGV